VLVDWLARPVPENQKTIVSFKTDMLHPRFCTCVVFLVF